MQAFEEGNMIEFDYVNWKGEAGHRIVRIEDFSFGSNEWHTEPQWLMLAWDLEKKARRYFAMKDMTNVKWV